MPVQQSRHQRLPADLAIMAGAISHYEEIAVPDLLDPLLRKKLEERFAALPEAVRAKPQVRINAAKAAKRARPEKTGGAS